MTVGMTFGQIVKRDRYPMTATEAAHIAGIGKAFWSDVEHGHRMPSRTVAVRMCGAVAGNWNDWLVAWAKVRLDGAFDDLAAVLVEGTVPYWSWCTCDRLSGVSADCATHGSRYR